MKFKNEDAKAGWLETIKAQKSAYGQATCNYAIRWVDEMEAQIDEGISVAQAAEATYELVNTDGITGFMCDFAIIMIVKSWEYGQELLEWHNGKHIKDEKELKKANSSGKLIKSTIFTIS